MTLFDAQNLAKRLMQEHGLTSQPQPWIFKFDRAVTRFGVCKYPNKRRSYGIIGLSAPLTIRNGEAEVKDTILHEIAHALAGFKAGHGIGWRLWAARIGARPVRCYEAKNIERPAGKYTCTCKHCGVKFPVYKVTRKVRQLLLEQAGAIPPGRSMYHASCGRTLGRLTIEPTK